MVTGKPKPKYYLTYLKPGEFGNDALWGVFTERVPRASASNWVAFYKTREAALLDYPEAVQV